MGLFEDVVINAKSALNVVGKKAGKIVDVSKLKISAVEIQNKISKLYEELGRCAYKSFKDGKELSCVEEYAKKIDALKEEYVSVDEKIAEMKKKIRCSKCGFINLEDAIYCCKCGAKIEPTDEKKQTTEDKTENKKENLKDETVDVDVVNEYTESSNES